MLTPPATVTRKNSNNIWGNHGDSPSDCSHPPILRRQKEFLRSHGAKGGSGSRARDGRSLRRDQLIRRREQLIRRWEQLIRRWEQLIWEKVVGLSEKSYHFLAGIANMGKFSREFSVYTAVSSSATTVLSVGRANTQREQSVFGAYIMYMRMSAPRARDFQKIRFTFHR